MTNMKRTKLYILYMLLISVLASSCSDFLDKEPLTMPNSENFLVGQPQVLNYINGLYVALPSLPKFGMGARGEEKNSDNILAENYDKRLNGELRIFDGGPDWTVAYQNLRNVNYFFANYKVDPTLETADLQSLKGEVYFLRAYWHFYLLTRFGSVPLMDTFWDNRATLEGLQIPAADRTTVAKFILTDLEKAKELLHPRSRYKGLRVSKEAAMILAMRVALFEGTWQKYHKGSVFDAAKNESLFFLEQVMKWGDELFALNTLQLHTKGGTAATEEVAFGQLFNLKDLSNISEAVFWRQYSNAGGVFHALTGLLGSGVVDQDGPAGVAVSLVNSYLNTDGTFLDSKDPKFKDFNTTFLDRDARLKATIMHSESKFKALSSGAKPLLVKKYNEAEKNTINPPYLRGDGQGRNVTGFHIRLGVDENFVSGNGDNAFTLIRYAEALLAYAEAAEELGKCDDTVLDKTIKLLRERAGVRYIKPTLIDNENNNFGYFVSANLQEIRRERRVELALQGYRLQDLLRWKAHSLFQGKTGRGAYFGKDGVLYQSFSETDIQQLLGRVLVDKDGWMNPLQQFLPGGYQFNENRDYLLPIPPEELALNRLLKQNPNWN